MVKVLIGNVTSRVIGYLPEDVHKELDQQLSYTPASVRHIKSVKEGKWDGRYRLYKKNYGQSFNTGLLSIVTKILDQKDVEYRKQDDRKRPEQNLPNLTFTPISGYEERDYQQFTIDRAIKRTRGILKVATGGGKCLGKGTEVLMFNGASKPVELITEGDLLMGSDSTPRTVLSTTVGFGQLYKVKQKNGDDFICNDAHILCLERTTCPNRKWDVNKQIEITAEDYLNSSKWYKHTHKGYKVGVEFEEKLINIDPYWLGLWLGDGTSATTGVTTGDGEIKNYIYKYAEKLKAFVTIKHEKGNCETFNIVTDRGQNNPLRTSLKEYNLLQNKHIPKDYKFNSRKNRLLLLAGLIDSDGNLKRTGSVEFCNSNKLLAESTCWLARSLGYRASCNVKKTSIKSTGYKGHSYRVIISGKITDIPLLKRKCKGDQTKYKALRYGISLETMGKGDYYGFEIDKDGKFLLGDFTVTHNTTIVTELVGKIKTAPFMFYVLTKDLMEQAYDEMSTYLNEPIGRIGGGQWDIQKINVCTVQTAVRAVNLRNKKFKISDYRFDEEDTWDKKQMEGEDKLENLKKLLRATKGLYFDETHHAAAKTCQDVLNASPFAFWRYGGSATPFREDGAEIMLQALFGRKVVDISASYLIDKGFLIEPHIFFEPIEQDCKHHAYKSIYSECIAKNDDFNAHVADTANFLIEQNMSTLVLVQQIQHGEFLRDRIPGSVLVTGKLANKKRKQAIQDLRDKKCLCMVATCLADEGLDIPTLDAALLAGGGASATRVHQRIGRTLRKDRKAKHPRDRSIVIYYKHDVKYLKKHANKALRIMKEEPRFNIVKSKGKGHILKEISDVMDFDYHPKTIFNL